MKKWGHNIFNSITMVTLLAVTLPFFTTGYTYRISHCHCTETDDACSIKPQASAEEENLPPCCRTEQEPEPIKHDCQDDCCVTEVHVEGQSTEYYAPQQLNSIKVFHSSEWMEALTSLTSPSDDIKSLETGPPGRDDGRHFLIFIHQLRIASPAATEA